MKPFTRFFHSDQSPGLILIFCTILSLLLANSFASQTYLQFWHLSILNKPLEFWINDAFMAVFFLYVGLEIKREIIAGKLAQFKQAALPVIAAVGGMIVPAIIHFAFNKGTIYQNGFGIPMATDIAFSLGVLSLLGRQVPPALKVFLTALAIIDDLGAIIVIALFYAGDISLFFIGGAAAIFLIMMLINRLGVAKLWPYLLLGCALWFCVYNSGIHPTIAGVLTAIAIPFSNPKKEPQFVWLMHSLQLPVSFIILPLFALANTAIAVPATVLKDVVSVNGFGIILGLFLGKPIGIFLFAVAGIQAGICTMPDGVYKRHILGAGLLAGIGFTMSIFISLLAFTDAQVINSSKIAVLIASVVSGVAGLLWLKFSKKKR